MIIKINHEPIEAINIVGDDLNKLFENQATHGAVTYGFIQDICDHVAHCTMSGTTLTIEAKQSLLSNLVDAMHKVVWLISG